MQTIKITTSQNIDIDYEVAGVGERILARLIDFALFILIFILGLLGGVLAGKKFFDSRITIFVAIIIYASLYVFYDLACEMLISGQSVGKRVMKIKVISLDGARPTFGQYLLRWLFRIVDFSLTSGVCGLISVAVSDKHQRVGDIVAGTTLIKTHPRTQLNNLVFAPVADSYQPVYSGAINLNDSDIALIQEVIRTYFQTGNTEIVYTAAGKIKDLLSVTLIEGMDDLSFLQTIVKDYTHLISFSDQPINS